MTDTYSLACSEPDDRGVSELVFGSGRPANAFTLELIDAFLALVRRIEGRHDIRVLVIRSAGAAFSGGADLGAMGSMSAETYQRYIAAEFELFAAIEELPLVTIAALVGACLGNAAELALACDFRVATDDVKFGLPETKLGFQGPALRLTRFVGIGVAKDLLYHGRVLDGPAAAALGLVTRSVPAADFDAAVAAAVAEAAALPAVAIRATKRNVHRAYSPDPDALQAEIDASKICYATEDFREGVAAFWARRPPVFQGR